MKRFVILAAVLLLTCPGLAFGGKISVSVITNAAKTRDTIRIADPAFAGRAIKIDQNYLDRTKPTATITAAGDALDADGKFSVAAAKGWTYTIHIGPAMAGDTWVVRRGTETYESFEERNARERARGMRGDLGGLPITVASSFFPTSPTGLDYILEFIDDSPSNSFAFTSLKIYKDLDFAFFTPALFDSPAAIASGTLALLAGISDDIAVPTSAAGALPILDIPIPDVSPHRYELIFGTAAPVLSDGSLGTPVSFAFAQAAAPEPPGAALLMLGLAAMLAARWRAQRRRSGSRSDRNALARATVICINPGFFAVERKSSPV